MHQAYLKLRVRRDHQELRRSPETFEVRDKFLKSISAVQRKSHKQSRLREHEVMLVKEIDILERTKDEVVKTLSIKKLQSDGDKAAMQETIKELWMDVDETEKATTNVMNYQAKLHSRILNVTSQLRELKDSVTIE